MRPVPADNCYACHARLQSGGLRVDSREALLEGGDSGPAIVPGDPDGSLLVRAVRHEIEGGEMPRYADPLAARDVERLVEWIRMGAPWPEAAPAAATASADLARPATPRREVTAAERDFWSFRPFAAPAVPEPARTGWARNDVDRFLLAKLEEKGAAGSTSPASARTTPAGWPRTGRRNRRIIAKGTPLDEVKSTPMPNGFESFFDRHQLELDTMERERLNLYTDVYRRDLDNTLDTFFPAPGLLRFRGWGLERQLGRVAADHVEAMRARIDELEEALPDLPFVMGVRDREAEDLTDIRLHVRGSPTDLGEEVPRGFVSVLAGKDAGPFTEGSGRLQLAEAIATHPLAARVIVNRVWRWHMGSGIVDTPSNFGFAGERPTNAELLEHLAARFVDGGMSIKRLHRDIMLSATYRLRAGRHAANEAVDAANRYYWRADRRRLDAESIRDALLHVSGGLDAKVGGPSVDLDDDDNDRRTLYGTVSRFHLDDYLQTFDFPDPNLSAERRYATNVPQQSLFFMNSPFARRQAERLVRRLAEEVGHESEDADETGAEGRDGDGTRADGEGGADRVADGEGGDDDSAPDDGEDIPARFADRAMIRAAYPLLYGREVSEAELEAGLAFLAERRASTKEPDDLQGRQASTRAWTQYARALFSVAEFRFIE